MKKQKSTILSYLPEFLFVSALGVLLHFTYDWSGQNKIVGLFSAINESTWEHLKLLFFPMLLLTLWQIFRDPDNAEKILPSRTLAILFGMLFIVAAFYTLSGVFGVLPGVINIAIYFVAVAFSLLIENALKKHTWKLTSNISWAILIIFTIAFFVFTFLPPSINLFTPSNKATIPVWRCFK